MSTKADLLLVSRPDGADWVELIVSGFQRGAPYQKTLMEGLALVRQHRVSGWLGDLSQARVMDPLDEKWSQEVWLPQAIQLGIKRIALIQPGDVFGRMQATRWERDPTLVWATLPYEMRLFRDADDARYWLSGHEARNSVLPGF